ncbi:huntingtin isoform X2 [Daktulosphaira vitifoliae]|uniref:huntingtin isoform X2 n=1 Tax=Daktulosphaira vitifoliae TaxID=58002 RepID=UPI0021A9ED06|nr:huntingtin isoform X2 [Daktulosphaira vitifoliae]
MSVIDRLARALDGLTTNDLISRAGEKEKYCRATADLICAPIIMNFSTFGELLHKSIDSLLRMCDHTEANVRMVAEENLNRVVRCMIDYRKSEIFVELLKEIKRNDTVRRLRAALSRFGNICHLITPSSRKKYVVFLIPCLRKIATRSEEPIAEMLALSFPKIMQSLGHIMSDNNIKLLLEVFMNSLVTESSTVRRSSITCIENLCLYSKKPIIFFKYVLLINSILIYDINKFMVSGRSWAESCVIIGILNNLKNILQYSNYIVDNSSNEFKLELKFLQKIYLQIFRFCCFVIMHPDTNIVTSALDTLTQLFIFSPFETLHMLLKRNMLNQVKLHETEIVKMHALVNTIKMPQTLAQSLEKSFHHSSSESLGSSFVNIPYPHFEDETRSVSQSLDSTKPSVSSANSMTNLYSEFGDDSLSEVDSIVDNIFFTEFENPKDFDEQSVISDHSYHSTSDSVLQQEFEFINQICIDIPLNILSKKITSMFLALDSNKPVRTGVKSSALCCLTEMIKLDPNLVLIIYNSSESVVQTVINYTSHEDHLLRGMAIKLIGTFISITLKENHGQFKLKETLFKPIKINDLISIILQGLKDESYMCVCNSLSAVSLCIMPLLNSEISNYCSPIFETILCGINPYWLVKVKLLEIIENLSFMAVYYATNSSIYQDRILERIVFKFLFDHEYNVRHAAAKCLVSVVRNCYFKIDYKQQDVVTSWVCVNTNLYCSDFIQLQNNEEYDIYGEASLSRHINRLTNELIKNQSMFVVAGCIEALTLLSDTYKSPAYPKAWKCIITTKGFNHNSTTSPCSALFTSVLSSLISSTALDLEMHSWMLKLSSNLVIEIANALQSLKDHKIEFGRYNCWFEDEKLKKQFNELWTHVLKLLNMFRNVILDYKEPTNKPISIQISEDIEKDKKTSKGMFSRSNYYYKLQSITKASYNNYKLSLENISNEKFIKFLESLLNALKVLLKYIAPTECNQHAERIILCLTSVANLVPGYSSQVLAELFKCIVPKHDIMKNHLYIKKEDQVIQKNNLLIPCLYTQALETPYGYISGFIDSKIKTSQFANKRWEEHVRRTSIGGQLFIPKSDNLDFSSNLKFFRPLIIKFLKEYVITGDILVQSNILELLIILIQFKINFNIIDPKQEFLNFLFNQFDYLENGLIRNPEVLISKIFNLFIHLSTDKSKSNNLISEAIRLCDGLMASGYPPDLYCIPAILPIVENVYVLKSAFMVNSSDLKELDAQREMLFAMLLRLCQFNEVINILSLVIMEGSEEKWRKQSRQLFDTLYTSFGGCKIQASLPSLLNLLLTLHPSSYSLQQQLHVLFNTCYDVEKCTLEPWLNTILSNLIIICIQRSEDVLLQRISEIDIFISSNLFELATQTDPLNASMFNKNRLPGEQTFAKFLFRVIYLSVNDIKIFHGQPQTNSDSKVGLLSEFLLTCQYIVQSGNFQKVVKALQILMNDPVFKILHKNIFTLTMMYPILVLHWVQFIGLLEYDNIDFWKSLIWINSVEKEKKNCFYLSVVQKGCFLILCEILSKKVSIENNLLKWFLSECAVQLLQLGNETSAQELLNCVNKDSTLSLIHLTAIKEKCVGDKMNLTNELLRIMNEAHPAHCGEVIKLILPSLLEDPHLAVSQFASSIAIRKMEYLLTLPISISSNQLSSDETKNILDYFNKSNISIKNRYCILISLFNKFGTQCYNFSSIEVDQNKIINISDIKNVEIDKNWFFEQVKSRCCRNDCPSFESAKLLSNLPLQDAVSIMRSDGFNYDILQHCFTISTLISIENWKKISEESSNLELCPLFVAARFVLIEHVQKTCSSLPKFHQIFLPLNDKLNEKQVSYKTQMYELFADKSMIKVILHIIPAVTTFLECVKNLSKYKAKGHIILMNSNKTLIKFTVFIVELLKWKLYTKTAAASMIQLLLQCTYCIFDVCELANDFCSTELGSIASTLISVVEFITEDILPLESNDYFKEKPELFSICQQLSSLVSWVEKSCPKTSTIYLNHITCSIIQILSRHPLINGYVRVPPEAWKILQNKSRVPKFIIPTIPVDIFKDVDILKQFISRLSVVGWNSKQQFEETWMILLSVLVPSSEANVPKEELISQIQASSTAVNGITQLFSQALFENYPGDTTKDTFLHVSRDSPLELSHHKWFIKLEEVNELIYATYSKFKRTASKECLLDRLDNRANIERIHDQHRYSYHQLSVKFLQSIITDDGKNIRNTTNTKDSNFKMQLYERMKIIKDSSLDLTSCISLLKEVFNQWMESKTRGSQSQISEMIKCLLVISDLFTEIEQYIWMLNVCLELSQTHHQEDIILHQYVIIGAAKAMAISNVTDLNNREKVLKLIENGLKSNCRLTQLAALHGLLYLLEGCYNSTYLQNNLEIIQIAVDFVQKHLCTEYSMLYEYEWQLCVISIAFYVAEHNTNNIDNSLLISLEGLTKVVSSSRNFIIYQALIQGFQRIVFTKYTNQNIIEQITLLALDRLSNAPPGFSLPALQLLLSCIYAEHYVDKMQSEIDPDIIVTEMEKVSMLFERIKKGSLLEVEITTVIMSKVLADIFPVSYVLMRVVGEFLSPSQPHPTHMCTVVNEIFERLIEESELDLLQDWVITSLSNFTHGLQIPMAIYCLICFFISSSTNKWLRAIFSHVRLRLGRYEYEDRKLLCLAALNFYNNLSNDTQKKLYKESFQSSAKSKNPFADILLCLE